MKQSQEAAEETGDTGSLQQVAKELEDEEADQAIN